MLRVPRLGVEPKAISPTKWESCCSYRISVVLLLHLSRWRGVLSIAIAGVMVLGTVRVVVVVRAITAKLSA